MTEGEVLSVQCVNCKKSFRPYGEFTRMSLPHEDTVTCKWCNHTDEYEWLDTETKKARYRKQHNLDENRDFELLKQKMDVLESKQIANDKEIELLREKLAILTKNEIKDLQDKAGDHQFNMNNLQGQITELKELLEKVSNWQDKHDGR